MLFLRIAIVAIAVIVAGATDADTEILETEYYGLDEQNEPTETELTDEVESSDSQPTAAADMSQPTSLPDADSGSDDRRGGRRHNQHQRGRHHHRHHGNDDNRRSHHRHGIRRAGNWTDEQKMTHICGKLQSRDAAVSARQVTSGSRTNDRRPRNGMHWKLRSLNETSRQRIVSMWNRRKQEMLRCCNEGTTAAKMQCVNNVKVERFDRVCSGDEPLCYWSALRSNSTGRDAATTEATPSNSIESTTSITTRCCELQGRERVECFVDAKKTYRQRMQERTQTQPSPEWPRINAHGRMARRRD